VLSQSWTTEEGKVIVIELAYETSRGQAHMPLIGLVIK
jgi:hypothetical protein